MNILGTVVSGYTVVAPATIDYLVVAGGGSGGGSAAGARVTTTSTGATATAPILRARYSAGTVICTASNTFLVVGDIA